MMRNGGLNIASENKRGNLKYQYVYYMYIILPIIHK